jgi:hypothetical protein
MQMFELALWVGFYVGIVYVLAMVLGSRLRRARKEQSKPAPEPYVHPAPVTDDEKLWASIFREDGEEGKCPSCGSEGFLAGPEAGFTQNIHCTNVACRQNIWIFPLGEQAELQGKREFNWYPDGPEKNAAALTMVKAAWLARFDSGKVYAKFNGDHPAKLAEHIGEGYGWAVVSYTPQGEPIAVEGPFADQVKATEAAGGLVFKHPPEPHRDPDNLTAHDAARGRREEHATRKRPDDDGPGFGTGLVVGHMLTADDARGQYKAPGEPLTPGGGSYGGGGASGAWEDPHKAEADKIVRSGVGIGLAAIPDAIREAPARDNGSGMSMDDPVPRAAEVPPSYDSGSSDSGSSGGGDSGGGGGGGGE